MRRIAFPALLLASFCGLAALPLACGGDGGNGNMDPPVCGNGKQESGEDCDLGAKNGIDGQPCSLGCRAISVIRSSLNVTWQILSQTGIEGFTGSTCSKVEADKARVIVVGPNNLRIEQDIDCSAYGRIIDTVCTRLPKGDYQATITLIRTSDKTAVTLARSSARRTNSKDGDTLNLGIDFGYDDLLNKGTLKGTLLLDVSWGEDKNTCDKATPKVTMESLWLGVNDGVKPVMGKSVPGTPLDGTPSGCFVPGQGPNVNRTSEDIAGLSIGAYRLHIKGFAGNNSPTYCKNLDVFAGPGTNNTPYKILVPAVVMGDAGACD